MAFFNQIIEINDIYNLFHYLFLEIYNSKIFLPKKVDSKINPISTVAEIGLCNIDYNQSLSFQFQSRSKLVYPISIAIEVLICNIDYG